MVDIVPRPPQFSDRQYKVRDSTGSLDPSKYLGDLYKWGTRLATTINNKLSPVQTTGQPMVAEKVEPVTVFTADMSQEQTAQAICYLVTCLQDASILPKKNGSF